MEKETDLEFLQKIRERVLRCERLTALETHRLLSLAEAGWQQTERVAAIAKELRANEWDGDGYCNNQSCASSEAVGHMDDCWLNTLPLSFAAPPSAPVLPEPIQKCGCKASTGICGSITRGTGKLDDHGYWEFPCTHKPDAVLPEGQPQKVCRTCGGTKEKPECVEFGHNGNPHTCMLCVHDFHESGETSGEGQTPQCTCGSGIRGFLAHAASCEWAKWVLDRRPAETTQEPS